ncbi:pfkB carbohydrate kinase family protein, partial [Vibrio parahaemolyticus V-223/04]
KSAATAIVTFVIHRAAWT